MNESRKFVPLLGLLAVLCSPALASINPGGLLIRGAVQTGPGEFTATEGDVVSLELRGAPSDLLWVFAAALDKAGEADYSNLLTLLLDRHSATGAVSGQFVIPHGLAGKAFTIVAVSWPLEGDSIMAEKVTMKIREAIAPADVQAYLPITDGG